MKNFIYQVVLLGYLLVMPLESSYAQTVPSRAQADTVEQQTALPGTYTRSAEHPRVFLTPSDLRDMVTRINTPGSFSAQIFSKLANQVKTHLAANIDWDAVYSGCDIETYLYSFSFEGPKEHADPASTETQLRAALHVKPGLLPPSGAAIAASRLALYAALVKAGAKTPAGAPTADQAAALAKRILLAWSSHGFRDQRGTYLNRAEQFCDDQDHFIPLTQSTVALQISRGVVYSAHAQDLLQSIGADNAAEANTLNAFHEAMFDLIREASNFRFMLPEVAKVPDRTCERFSNHAAAGLMGMLSIARLLDDNRKFNAVFHGKDPTIPVTLSWTAYFEHAIYGENDRPIACYKNSGPDRLSSHGSFQTSVVAPGEIEDRYRNANPAQGFGYTLGVLADFYDMTDLMKNAGFNVLSYRGTHGQSVEMAAGLLRLLRQICRVQEAGHRRQRPCLPRLSAIYRADRQRPGNGHCDGCIPFPPGCRDYRTGSVSKERGRGESSRPTPFRAVAGLIGAPTDAGKLAWKPM